MDILNTFTLNSNRQIKINFDGGDLSSDAGLLLIKEFAAKIGFTKLIKKKFKTNDKSVRFHKDDENLMQMIYQIISAYFVDDCADELTLDPVFNVLWKWMTEEEIEEMRINQRDRGSIISKGKHGRRKRKTYSEDTRKLIYLNAGGRCELCGRKILLDDMTIDHVKPLSMGGEDDVSNLACTCLPCNVFKGNILPENFLNRINDIFMYQTEKNTKHKLKWKIVHRLLLSCIK